ncbi:MAG: choice-of-anchor D domain-containing protein, partial [Verrucomicrobia bacterium]
AWAAGDGARIYHRPGSSLNNGILTIEPASLNFGFVAVGDSSPRVLTFYNRSRSSLTINSVAPTVGGLSGDLVYSPAPPQTIPAGGSLAMNVSFRPTTDRDFTGELIIFSNDPDGNVAAGISGRSASHGWVLKANLPNSAGQTVVDLQMVSDTIGYAITSTRFYKTTDGGNTWTQLSVPTSYPLRALHFTSTSTGYIAGGRSDYRFPRAMILRTSNGGSSWATVYSSSSNPVMDLHFASDKSAYGYAVTEANGKVYGSVLRSTNGGTSWSPVNKPSFFDGLAVHAVSSTEVFVATGARVYRSSNSGSSWTQVIYNGSDTIRDIYFSGSSYGYAVGDHGTMWRTLIGGDTSSEWSRVTSFTTEPLNRVHVGSFYDAWVTTSASASSGRIYRTRDRGVNWEEELSQSLYAGPSNLKPTVVWARNANLAVALGTEGCVRRYEAYLSDPVGIAVAPPVLDFGTAAQGQQITRTFTLRNAGAKTLLVSNARVNGSEVGNDDFKWTTSLPFSITPGGSRTVSIVAFNRAPGPVSAQLEIVTDGVDPTTTVELRSAVPVPPAVVVFQTSPPGLSLRIDGVTRTAPVAYTIVESSAVSGEWLAGSSHSIEALDPQTVAGQDFAFSAWDPAEDRLFSYTAEMRSRTYTAHFVVSQSGSGGGGGQGFAAMAGNGGGNPPPGVNTGPYIRLSNATLTAPALGNFTATGAALLSVDLIDISLTTTPLILRPNPSTAPVAEITSSAWRFLYSSASGSVQLSAQSPALKLVGNAVTPPSSLDLYFNSAGHFRGNFSLPQGWKVAPGLLEFGPSSLTLAHTNFFYLASFGQARLLREPDGNWAYTPTLNLEFRDGPFTNTIALPSSIMRLTLPGTTTEFVELHGGAGSKFELRRSASGNYTALLNNVGLDLMGQSVGAFSGTASTSGQITFSAAPPASPFVLGPFRWHASGTSTLYWNVKNGALSFNLAGGTLKDSGNSVP